MSHHLARLLHHGDQQFVLDRRQMNDLVSSFDNSGRQINSKISDHDRGLLRAGSVSMPQNRSHASLSLPGSKRLCNIGVGTVIQRLNLLRSLIKSS